MKSRRPNAAIPPQPPGYARPSFPHRRRARSFMRGARFVQAAVAVCGAVVLLMVFLPSSSGTPVPHPEEPDLNVAVVPAVDSAGFSVALHKGLFSARGLHVTFIPAVSSEDVIDAQAIGEPGDRVDISCGNYVSYIQAQQAYDQGQRPSPANPHIVAADLDIFAEGSVMQAATQGLCTMPGSGIQTLSELEGKTIGVNAPGNILYLLAASVLAEHGIPVSRVRFADIPLPQMAAELKAGKINAAVLPEPFASQAELAYGVVPLTDLDQGATTAFPVQGCAVTKTWAATHPATLAAFRAAFEQGQQIADTSRAAVEQAMETLPHALAVSKQTAAVMALDSYPVGPVDVLRIQRVAEVMRQFLGFPEFNVTRLLGGR